MQNIFRASTFNLAEAQEFIEQHRLTKLPHYIKMKEYYDGKHDILARTQTDTSKPNIKLVNNFPSYIVEQSANYFMGTPVQYSCDNDALMEKLQDILKYNDSADIDAQHAENLGIYGCSFELHYIDKEDDLVDTRFAVVSPEEIFVVYDYDLVPSPLYAIRYYTVELVKNEPTTKVEVYTTNQVLYYTLSGSEWILEGEIEHLYKDVPVIEILNNNDRVNDFEKVISLIDEYNRLESDSANDFAAFTDAYLFLKGALLDETAAVDMKNNRIINVAEEGAEASFLIKEIQDGALENVKNRIVNDIHKFSNVPNLTDESFSGNLSGVAIKYKLLGLENIASKKERRFKKGLQRRLELLTSLLFVRGLIAKSNYFDVNIAFNRTMPANDTEIIENVNKLTGTVSQETLLTMLPFIDDAKAEMQRIKDEAAKDNSYEAAFTLPSVTTNQTPVE